MTESKASAIELYRHSGPVNCIALSPCGQFVAIAGGGRLNRERRKHRIYKEQYATVVESDIPIFSTEDLRQAATKREKVEPLFVQKGHDGPVTCLHWAEDGWLWSGGADSRVRRHDLEYGVQTGNWKVFHDAMVIARPIDNDRLRATFRQPPENDSAANQNDELTEHEQDAKEHLDADWFISAAKKGKADSVEPNSAEPAEDPGFVIGMAADRIARTLDLSTGRSVESVSIGKHIIMQAAWVGDDLIAASLQDGELRLLTASTMECTSGGKFDEAFYSFAPASQGKFWSGDRLGKIRLHQPSGEVEKEFEAIEGARLLSLAFDPERNRLATGNIRGEWLEIDAGSGEALGPLNNCGQRATMLHYLSDHLLIGDYGGGFSIA